MHREYSIEAKTWLDRVQSKKALKKSTLVALVRFLCRRWGCVVELLFLFYGVYLVRIYLSMPADLEYLLI
jgi:hypothetical protein